MKKQILAIMVASLFTVVAAAAQANEAAAVVSPVLRGGASEDEWIAQFVQDSLTQNLVRYTKMRVIDRANESLIMAEQKRSESALYDDADAIELGRMTSARLVLLCTIQKIGVSWELSLRVNDLETNEIKAVASGRFSSSELESASAVNTVTAELFQAWGINLTAEQKAELSKTNSDETRSVKSLAKGAAAEKAGDTVSALAFYAQTNGAQKAEAETNSARLLDGTIHTGSIKEKAAFFNAQEKKWEETFSQLQKYLEHELPIFVYDFSDTKDNITGNYVSIAIGQGVKVVPRRAAVLVWKEVVEAWQKILANKENSSWTQQLRQKYYFGKMRFIYDVKVYLYNDDGSYIENAGWAQTGFWLDYEDARGGNVNANVKSQQKYFETDRFDEVKFTAIKIDDITGDSLVPRIYEVKKYNGDSRGGKALQNPVIVSADEWEEFSKGL